eukprot:scaffold27567_cov51-Phaeocystis_antarctica.AAC.1
MDAGPDLRRRHRRPPVPLQRDPPLQCLGLPSIPAKPRAAHRRGRDRLPAAACVLHVHDGPVLGSLRCEGAG